MVWVFVFREIGRKYVSVIIEVRVIGYYEERIGEDVVKL